MSSLAQNKKELCFYSKWWKQKVSQTRILFVFAFHPWLIRTSAADISPGKTAKQTPEYGRRRAAWTNVPPHLLQLVDIGMRCGVLLNASVCGCFVCVSAIPRQEEGFLSSQTYLLGEGGRPCPWARREGPSPGVPCYQWFPRLASLGKAGWTHSKISIICIVVLTLPESQAHNENNSNSHNLKPFSEHKAALSHLQTAFLKQS